MGIFDDIPTRSNANDDYVEASWWNIIKQKLQEAFPNITAVTGDVVGTTDTQILTNKTFDDELTLKELTGTISTPDTGYKKVYPKDDGKLYSLNSDGDEVEIGSGGEGGKNYFDQDSAKLESGTVGSWLTDDGAGSASAGLTLSVTTTVGELLEGTNSLKLVKDAANRTGHFIKLASQTIDPIDRGKQLFGSFAFKPISGYVSGDLILEVYDVTNSAVLYSGASEDLELLNVTGPTTFNYNTQLESTTAQIELRLKVNNTNTNTFTMTFDEFKFGPAAVLPATFERYEEITLVNSGTNNISGTVGVGRTGNQVALTLIDLTFTSSSTPVTAASVLPSWARSEKDFLSNVSMSNTTVMTRVYVADTGAIGLIFYNYSGTETAQTSVDNLTISYTVPSTQYTMTTNELGLSAFKVKVNRATAQTFDNGVATDVIFNNVVSDKFNSFNTSTGVFTAPVHGLYMFVPNVSVGGMTAGTGDIQSFIADSSNALLGAFDRKGIGAPVMTTGTSDLIEMFKGGTAKMRISQSNGATRSSSTGLPAGVTLSIYLVQDLTLIGAVKERETIQTKILGSNVTTNGTVAALTFDNLEVGMWYEVSGSVQLNINDGGADGDVSLEATHNSTILKRFRSRIVGLSGTTVSANYENPSFKFKAEAASLTFVTVSASANSYLVGTGSKDATYIQLTKKTGMIETDIH